MCTVPWSLDTQISDASWLKLILEHRAERHGLVRKWKDLLFVVDVRASEAQESESLTYICSLNYKFHKIVFIYPLFVPLLLAVTLPVHNLLSMFRPIRFQSVTVARRVSCSNNIGIHSTHQKPLTNCVIVTPRSVLYLKDESSFKG